MNCHADNVQVTQSVANSCTFVESDFINNLDNWFSYHLNWIILQYNTTKR